MARGSNLYWSPIKTIRMQGSAQILLEAPTSWWSSSMNTGRSFRNLKPPPLFSITVQVSTSLFVGSAGKTTGPEKESKQTLKYNIEKNVCSVPCFLRKILDFAFEDQNLNRSTSELESLPFKWSVDTFCKSRLRKINSLPRSVVKPASLPENERRFQHPYLQSTIAMHTNA